MFYTIQMVDGGRKILLAEDEAIIRELGRQVLENEGFEVITAPDGETAVTEIRKRTCYAVITDFNLRPKGLTGADVAKEAIAAEIKRVLIATGNPNQVPEIEGVKIIQKPFSWKDIARILKDITQEPSVIQEYSSTQGLSVNQGISATQGLSAAPESSVAQESSATQGSSANEEPPSNQ